jgi:hypothetical protein
MPFWEYWVSVRYRKYRIICLGASMPILGYLRHYLRWDGSPGTSVQKQQALVRMTCPDRDEHRQYTCEAIDGEIHKWPALKSAIGLVNVEDDLTLVVPTLDGVQFNLPFLELLERRHENASVIVRSGWRRVGVLAKDTNHWHRATRDFWRLSVGYDAVSFGEMVNRVRKRNQSLSAAIKSGLRIAADSGVRLRSRNPHRFTANEQCKGGQRTARKRRLAANEPYCRWIPKMRFWRENGESIREIMMRLEADPEARKPDGRKIGPMLVHRILQRESKANTPYRDK